MQKLYPFAAYVTGIFTLISTTLSFLCFPVIALLVVHAICKAVFSMSLYNSQVAGTMAFIIVGLYSLIGLVYMYFRYFKYIRKK